MANSRRRILITGGLGFIGWHLASRLSRETGTDVVLVDNLARGRLDGDARRLIARGNVRFVQGDVTLPSCYARLGAPFHEVYHCAAIVGVQTVIEHPETVLRVNTLSIVHLLEWFVAGGAERLLLPSTSEVYAWTQHFHELPVPTPEDVPLAVTDLWNPRVGYAATKIFAELAVTQYCQRHGKRFAIVRYHNVYGPRMGTQHVIPELYLRAVCRGENPVLVYSPDHRRAFCYVDDAVDATIAAMRVPAAAGGTFNVGNDGEEISILDLARRILRAAGVNAAIEGRAAPNDPIRRRCPDLTRARRVLGWRPAVALEAGLRRTLAWYEQACGAGV